MSILSKLLGSESKLFGKAFLTNKQLILRMDNTSETKSDELKIEFRKNFIIVKNLKTGIEKQLFWRFISKDDYTETFSDENYGQWLISNNHITYTEVKTGINTSFYGHMV